MKRGPKSDVLILGYEGFGAVGRLAKAVKERGRRPIAVVNTECGERHVAECDLVVRCDVFDATAIMGALEVAGLVEACGGVCSQFDFLSFAYAALASGLNMAPQRTVDAILRCRLKHRMRTILAGDEVEAVASQLVRGVADCRGAAGRVGLPCIAKPVGGAASFAVRRCRSVEELERYVGGFSKYMGEQAPFHLGVQRVDGVSYDLGRDVLVEAELDGPELTCDGYVAEGKVEWLLIQEILLTQSETAFRDVGFISPPLNVSREAVDEVKSVVERAIRLLNFDNLMFHVEVKVTSVGPKIVEFNPRFGGGPIAKIAHYVSGRDPGGVFVDLMLARRPAEEAADAPAPPNTYFGYYTLFADKAGTVTRIHGLDKLSGLAALAEPPVVVALEGERIPPFLDKTYVAFVLFCSEDPRVITESIVQASQLLSCELAER